jgi:hypothetical protein
VDQTARALGLLLFAAGLAWLSVRAARAAAAQLGIPSWLASAGVSAIAHGIA